jgi:Fe2+ transport system protein FeoA
VAVWNENSRFVENENRFQFVTLPSAMAAAPKADFSNLALERTRIDGARIDTGAVVSLSGLAPGGEAVILAVDGEGPESLRLRDLGFVRGTHIRSIKRAPFGDPVVYDLRGYRLCLRRSESDRVRVKPI